MPDVEALARFLDASLRGVRVTSFQLGSFTALKTVSPPPTRLRNARLLGVERRGKIVLLRAETEDDGGPLVLGAHLYRAGWVAWRSKVPAGILRPGKGTIVARLATEAGAADFTEAGSMRRLALWLVERDCDIEPIASYGPEALDLAADADAWFAALHDHPARAKTWLADQRILAGIGNGYSDDILQAARLSPFAATDRLSPAQAERLRDATRTVLLGAVERLSGVAPAAMKAEKKAGYSIHGREGEPCPTCGTEIRSVNYATRSFQYCPTCQTGGRPLADRTTSRFVK